MERIWLEFMKNSWHHQNKLKIIWWDHLWIKLIEIKLIEKFFNRLLRTNWKQKITGLINDVNAVATKIVKIINLFSKEFIYSFDTNFIEKNKFYLLILD